MAYGRRPAGLIVLVALVAVAAGAWFFRAHIPGPWNAPAVSAQVSPEAADAAQAKLQRLRQDGATVQLTDDEFTSLMRYRMPEVQAFGLYDPVVRFEDDRVRVSGRFPTDRLPEVRELDAVRGFLPDTADVMVAGRMRPLGPGRAALRFESVSFARFPVPREFFPRAIERLGPTGEAGIDPDEYAFPLPDGVGAAAVENGMLILAPAG